MKKSFTLPHGVNLHCEADGDAANARRKDLSDLLGLRDQGRIRVCQL